LPILNHAKSMKSMGLEPSQVAVEYRTPEVGLHKKRDALG